MAFVTVSIYTKMGSDNNDIPDGLSIVDKYVQITINKLYTFVKIG